MIAVVGGGEAGSSGRGLTFDEVNALNVKKQSKLTCDPEVRGGGADMSDDDDEESIPSSLPSLVSEPPVTSSFSSSTNMTALTTLEVFHPPLCSQHYLAGVLQKNL